MSAFPFSGGAQTAGTGFTLTSVADLDGNGFNSDDNGSSEHVITNRSDTGARIDLDGDMNYEIIVMGKNTNDDLVILENSADDTYVKVWGIDLNSDTASYFPQSAAVADSDGDGLLEIIAIGAGTLRIFEMAAGAIADGSNPSDTPMYTVAVSGASAVTAGFFDADASMDIVITSRDETGGLVVIENNGDNSYAAATSTDVGNDSGVVDDGGAADLSLIADLDGDGVNEIAVAPDRQARSLDSFFVFRWNGTSFTEEARLPIASPTSDLGLNNVMIYDLDGNGTAEILMTDNSEDILYIYESSAADTYTADAGTTGVIDLTGNIGHLAVGDYDADLNLEIYLPWDDDPTVGDVEKMEYIEHDGTAGAFAAANFSAPAVAVSNCSGAGTESVDPRGVAYAQGSLDGDTRGDLFVVFSTPLILGLEASASGSSVPVELMSFTVK
jgi:hypothetical protein